MDNSKTNLNDTYFETYSEKKKELYIFSRMRKKKSKETVWSPVSPTYASDNPIIITKIFGTPSKGEVWPDVVERCLRI